MKVFLPFAPELLGTVPPGLNVEVVDATQEWPPTAADCEFYVPAYRFSARVVEVLSTMPRLRIVQTLTAGIEHVLPHLPPGVTLCNGAGIHDAATSELAVGLMIAAQRRLFELAVAQREARWDPEMAGSLADSRVVVVGAGHIARALQRRLAGFECSVTLVGRTARDDIAGVESLSQLLPEADIVVLLVPLTDDTRGLVDARFLARLPTGALVVNVARGPVVVTDALVAELRAQRLRAALDVTDPEPLPGDHPLWSLPGVLLTPHVGGASSAMWPRSYALVRRQLERLAAGKPLDNVVVAG